MYAKAALSEWNKQPLIKEVTQPWAMAVKHQYEEIRAQSVSILKTAVTLFRRDFLLRKRRLAKCTRR